MSTLRFVHRFIPSGSKGHSLTLLALHGTGGDENNMLPLSQQLDPNASVLSPRGKILENGMPRFFRRFVEGVFDVEDLKKRTVELADFVLAATKEYGFDGRRVVALGYSNGANIAASMLLLRPEILAGALLFRVTLPLSPESSPHLASKHIFISAGNYDQMIPRSGTERLIDILRKSGADVEVHWQESDHGLTAKDIKDAKSWLTRHFPE
jgi:phospholipase/carboxylesterase